MTVHLIAQCDGASRGNPGPAAAGVVLLATDGAIVGRLAVCLGDMTNNQAEYHAVLAAAQLARVLGATSIDFRLDSELAVRQLSGDWKLKNPELRDLAARVHAAIPAHAQATFSYMPRAYNFVADRLANWALDRSRPGDAGALPPV